jgi:hypothetical protein
MSCNLTLVGLFVGDVDGEPLGLLDGDMIGRAVGFFVGFCEATTAKRLREQMKMLL